MPIESLPPLIIIVTAMVVIGGIQSGVEKLYAGKPKAPGRDTWDRLLDARDARLKADEKARAPRGSGEAPGERAARP